MAKEKEITVSHVIQSCPDEKARVCVSWSPVNELMYEENEDENGVKSYQITNDVCLLFNQRRLENLGIDTARDWLSDVQGRLSQPLKEAPNLTDNQLMDFIKSKHIQSPSELLSWSKYLDDQAAQLKQKEEDESTFTENLKKLRAKIFGTSDDKKDDAKSSE